MPGARSRFDFKPVDLIVVVAAFVLIVALAAVYFVPDLIRGRDWVTADAVVSSVGSSSGEVTIRFVFVDDGGAQEGVDVVPEAALEALPDARLEEGDQIEVRYPKNQPDLAESEFTARGSLAGLIGAITTAALLSVLALYVLHRRRGRHSPASTRGSGLMRCVEGRAVVGASRRRSEWLELHVDRLEFRRGNDRTAISWDAIAGVRISPRKGVPSVFASHDLEVTIGDSARVVPLRAQPGRPLPHQADFDAVVAVLSFCIAYTEARFGLGVPDAVAGFVDEMQDAIARTRAPASRARRWPQATAEQRRMLDVAMLEMCAASGVELFGRRTIRGLRLEADPAVVASARAWIPEELAGISIADEVLGEAIGAVQGARPSWPLDLLLVSETSA